ncbi:unnamed protein product [Eruca vesicaria subsp. sativa]|uniref:Uncharacterized protein n=1 Tax=Eruca vesicaria subsp. sativa TaxID=29727 RepID=A0ABC8L0G4_ERUVS|nr:unnamed protein product [Eruca vesicaria subsp. sativa]
MTIGEMKCEKQKRLQPGTKKLERSLFCLFQHLSRQIAFTVLLAVPALLYAINNYLKFTMQLYFNPATVKMLSNLKVLVIAPLLKMVMKRRFSIIQGLALLLIGISVNQLRSLPEGATAIGIPLATGAYICTVIFLAHFDTTKKKMMKVVILDPIEDSTEPKIEKTDSLLGWNKITFNFRTKLSSLKTMVWENVLLDHELMRYVVCNLP